MGKPYSKEIRRLERTFSWAQAADITGLEKFSRASRLRTLCAVGSGGSLAAAHLLSHLHRKHAGQSASYLTPLQFILDEPPSKNGYAIMLSASGRNDDILVSAQQCIATNGNRIASLTMASQTPLDDVVTAAHGYTCDLAIPTGRDGYLATNTLLASCVIACRLYLPTESSINEPEWALRYTPAIDVPNLTSAVILHGGWSSPAATDLESRLHESTLLAAQIADYRNFGHGRHLWLEKHSTSTVVLCLVTPDCEDLAARTIRHLPRDVARIQLKTDLPGASGAVDLIVRSMLLTEFIARERGVDPGKPKVPTFGRKLYRTKIPRKALAKPAPHASKITASSARRMGPAYAEAHCAFIKTLTETPYGSVVFDYDGTLCATESRFDPLETELASEVVRLLRAGVQIGIATGRGKSAGLELRKVIPRKHWESVLVGYYNGAEIGTLADDDSPDKERRSQRSLKRALSSLRDIAPGMFSLTVRPRQITCEPLVFDVDLYTLLRDVLLPYRVKVVRSGHSVDIIDARSGKQNVINQLQRGSPGGTLAIGDQGAPPGNDSELLHHPNVVSLSVKHVSSSLTHAWRIGPLISGPQLTLWYLRHLQRCRGKKLVKWRVEGNA